MAIDVNALLNKAKAGQLRTSSASEGDSGVKVGAGLFLCQLAKAEVVEGFTNKQARNLKLHFAVSKAVEETQGIDLANYAGAMFTWYFPQACEKNQDHMERVVGDMIAIGAAFGISAEDILDDADDVVDMFNNFSAKLAKKLKAGPAGEFLIGRSTRRKDPSKFDSWLSNEQVDLAADESKAEPADEDFPL